MTQMEAARFEWRSVDTLAGNASPLHPPEGVQLKIAVIVTRGDGRTKRLGKDAFSSAPMGALLFGPHLRTPLAGASSNPARHSILTLPGMGITHMVCPRLNNKGARTELEHNSMLTAIDIFCGAGLWSYAAQCENISIVAGIDHDAVACATYCVNHPHARCIQEDVRAIDFRSFAGVDLVIGSPPCITYSCAAGARRCDSDEALHFARAVTEIRPRAFVLENVPEFARFSSFRSMMRQFDGFFVYVHILNSADFGVPQRRRRMFVVGSRDLIPRTIVESRQHRSVGAILDPTAPMRPIESLSARTRARIADISESRFVLIYYSQDFRGWQSLHEPLRTVTTVNKFLLTDKRSGTARMLTECEVRRAMDIPDSYAFCGNQRSRLRQIGNAVVPSVARFVLRMTCDAFCRSVVS